MLPSLDLSRDWRKARISLAQVDPVALAVNYGGFEPTVKQQAWMRGIYSQAPDQTQQIAKCGRRQGKTRCAATTYAALFARDPTVRIFHLAGSYLQATRLYEYFKPLATNPELFPPGSRHELDGEPTKYLTRFKAGGTLEVLTASAKSIRGGGADVLSMDEAVLIPMHLITAAWPIVRESRRPKIVVMSTASPEVNLPWFLDLWQNAEEKGFRPHEWTTEDCPWINRRVDELAARLWDRETIKIEYEGGIGERAGAVWGSQLLSRAFVDPNNPALYPPPAPDPLTDKWAALDWGFVGQAVLTFYEKQGDLIIIRDVRIWTKEPYTEIKQEIKEDFARYPIYPDSESVSDNEDLTRMGLEVHPVVFSKRKLENISHIRWLLENGLLRIPDPAQADAEKREDWFTFRNQLEAYHWNEKTGKPVKLNDHCCDSLICGVEKLQEPERRPYFDYTVYR